MNRIICLASAALLSLSASAITTTLEYEDARETNTLATVTNLVSSATNSLSAVVDTKRDLTDLVYDRPTVTTNVVIVSYSDLDYAYSPVIGGWVSLEDGGAGVTGGCIVSGMGGCQFEGHFNPWEIQTEADIIPFSTGEVVGKVVVSRMCEYTSDTLALASAVATATNLVSSATNSLAGAVTSQIVSATNALSAVVDTKRDLTDLAYDRPTVTTNVVIVSYPDLDYDISPFIGQWLSLEDGGAGVTGGCIVSGMGGCQFEGHFNPWEIQTEADIIPFSTGEVVGKVVVSRMCEYTSDTLALASAVATATNLVSSATNSLAGAVTANLASATNAVTTALSGSVAAAAAAATNYTASATNSLTTVLSGSVAAAAAAATNYTASAVSSAATASTNYTDSATNSLASSIDFTPSNSTLVSTIESVSPQPGDYANVSNLAYTAVQNESDPVWLADKPGITNAIATVAADTDMIYRLYSGSNAVLEVTNYNSQVRASTMRLLQLTNNTEYITIWTETNGLTRIATAATNYTDAAVLAATNRYALRGWSSTTSGLGADAPSETTWISTPTTVIAGGYEYTKTVTSAGAVWFLTTNGMTTLGEGSSSSYLDIAASDGTSVMKIEKTDSYLVGVAADAISVSGNEVTVNVNVVSDSHPYLRYAASLSSTWYKEEESTLPEGVTVAWSGSSGAWVATVTTTATQGYFYFEFTQEGSTKILLGGGLDVTNGVYYNNTLYMPSVSGTELKFIAQ